MHVVEAGSSGSSHSQQLRMMVTRVEPTQDEMSANTTECEETDKDKDQHQVQNVLATTNLPSSQQVPIQTELRKHELSCVRLPQVADRPDPLLLQVKLHFDK